MIKHKKLIAMLQCIMSITLFFSLPSYAEINITVGDYPPFVEVYSPNHGVLSQLVQDVFKLKGLETNIIYSNWDDAEQYVDNGNHLSFMWIKNSERRKKWLFSEPIYQSQFVLLAKKSNKFTWRYYDDLIPYKIGITSGYYYGDRFSYYQDKLTLEQNKSDYIGVKKLLSGKIDVLLIEHYVAKNLLTYFSKQKQSQLEIVNNPILFEQPTYLVCSKKYAKCFYYLDKFNNGLKQLKATGQYQERLKVN